MNSLLMAWETTIDDVENVLRQMGIDEISASEVHDQLDHEMVAAAALEAGTEMEEQTNGAYAEIKRQINDLPNS